MEFVQDVMTLEAELIFYHQGVEGAEVQYHQHHQQALASYYLVFYLPEVKWRNIIIMTCATGHNKQADKM